MISEEPVFSPAEEKIFNLLKDGRLISLDKIQSRLKMTSNRKSMIVRMKYFSAKAAQHGWIVSRESGIGRGVKANYKMTKRF